MPKFAAPMIDAVGVVIRYEGEIVGAYIQSSLINRVMCTLDRKSFKDITGSSVEEYILNNNIDKNSNIEKQLLDIKPEDIIEMYFNSIKEKNITNQLATLDISNIISILDMNSYQKTLFEDPNFENNLSGYLKDF